VAGLYHEERKLGEDEMIDATRAKEIIEQVLYITIGSVSKDGQPWNAPVFSAYDQDYNFYWGSNADSQHSRNVRDTGRVFLVIYDSTAPAGHGEGVYVQAAARELSDPGEINEAHSLLQARRDSPYWKLEQVQGEAPVRLYKATREKAWTNDGTKINGTYVDVRSEVQL
jgi:hypothetical protein